VVASNNNRFEWVIKNFLLHKLKHDWLTEFLENLRRTSHAAARFKHVQNFLYFSTGDESEPALAADN
jgi:hypothetical protein